jgi:hypothetical protein
VSVARPVPGPSALDFGAVTRRVIIEMREPVPASLRGRGDGIRSVDRQMERSLGLHDLDGFELDEEYGAIALSRRPTGGRLGPRVMLLERLRSRGPASEPLVTWVIRGVLSDDAARDDLMARDDVVGVYADPTIEPFGPCLDDGAIGGEQDVAEMLDVAALGGRGMDGAGVLIAVVDFGVNLAHLTGRGRTQTLDVDLSWSQPGLPAPGEHDLGHGTMVAYDAGIAAPAATLVDLPLFPVAGSGLGALLSTGIAMFDRLIAAMARPDFDARGVVILNAWGMNTPAEDDPVGTEGNYSDNPAHPFTQIVRLAGAAGADVVFAAGNCGPQCPGHRCGWSGAPPIVGANSDTDVLTVGAIDVNGQLAGYSAHGPGRLGALKPDVVTYTHFEGSHARSGPDFGTSAAAGVAAGLLAAVRTRHERAQVSPARLRALASSTAGATHEPGFGWGSLNPTNLVAALDQ